MDIENATEQPIIVQTKAGPIAFPLLTFRELGLMLAKLRAARQADLIDSLRRAEVSDKARVEALREFDESALTLSDGMRWCKGVEGTVATLTASLRHGNPQITEAEIDATLDRIPADELMLAGARLWGAIFRVGAEAQEDKPPADPLARSLQPTSTGG